MDPQSRDKILEKLTKAENILILISPESEIDGLAAGLALHLSFGKLSKNSSVWSNTPTVEIANKLYGVNKIGEIKSDKNVVVTVKNAVETVEKVTYSIDQNNQLNIVIHALEKTNGVSKDQISIKQTPVFFDLIFAIGITSEEQMKEYIAHDQYINSNSIVVSINKQVMSSKFAQIELTDIQASGLSETLARIIQSLALPINEDIAYNLYFGISEATNQFSPTKTTISTFEIASWLVKFGAGKASLAQSKIEQKSQDYSVPTQIFDISNQKQPPPKIPVFPPIEQKEPVSQVLQEPDESFDYNTFYELPSDADIQKRTKKSWLKPPKIYKGSKSFDTKN